MKSLYFCIQRHLFWSCFSSKSSCCLILRKRVGASESVGSARLSLPRTCVGATHQPRCARFNKRDRPSRRPGRRRARGTAPHHRRRCRRRPHPVPRSRICAPLGRRARDTDRFQRRPGRRRGAAVCAVSRARRDDDAAGAGAMCACASTPARRGTLWRSVLSRQERRSRAPRAPVTPPPNGNGSVKASARHTSRA